MNFLIDENNVEQSFKEIAQYILNEVEFIINDYQFEFTEIEFYFQSETHPDESSHKHNAKAGDIRFHQYGFDIALNGLNDPSNVGGVLIRGVKLNNEFVNGPLSTKKFVFNHLGAINDLTKTIGIRELAQPRKDKIYQSKRIIGTSRSMLFEPFRYYTNLTELVEHKFVEYQDAVRELLHTKQIKKEDAKALLGVEDMSLKRVVLSSILKKDYPKVTKELTTKFKKYNIQFQYLKEANDYWVRDFMPVQVGKNEFVQFKYEPSYLEKPKYGKFKTNPKDIYFPKNWKITHSELNVDGGNVLIEGKTAIITNRVIRENKSLNLSEEEIYAELKNLLKVDKLVVIPADVGCKFGHIDGMLQFIDERTILMSEFYYSYTKFYNQDYEAKDFINPLKAQGVNVIPYKLGVPRSPKQIPYINFLKFDKVIFIPQLANQKELNKRAVDELQKYYPNHSIEPIQLPSELLELGGALHCITWEIN